jgi:hypothetical protein
MALGQDVGNGQRDGHRVLAGARETRRMIDGH